MGGVLLLVYIRRMEVISVEVRPTTKWNNVDVDVDTDAVDVLFAVVQTLFDRARSDMSGRTDCRVTVVLLPRRLSAARYTTHQRNNSLCTP